MLIDFFGANTMSDDAEEFWQQLQSRLPWMADTRHARELADGYRRGGSTVEETALLIEARKTDTQPRRPGRPRKHDAGTVMVYCRLTAEQVKFLDDITEGTRSETLARIVGKWIRLMQIAE